MRARTWGVLAGALLVGASWAPVAGQVRWTTGADERRCDRNRGDDERFCEAREATFAAPARLEIDGGANGGIEVRGSDRRDVHVVAHVSARARDEARAREIASRVEVSMEDGRLRVRGPESARRESWDVSWEVEVPRSLDLSAATENGGIAIADVSGAIEFDATNGGIDLARVGGDVRGHTVNGGLHVELAGSHWEGKGLDARTTNGGITLDLPKGYGAELETGTENGGFDVDFPITVQGRLGRTLRTTLGSGGPPIRAVTTNGGVRVRSR